MKLAYVIYDGITWLDLIGVYDPVSRLKSLNLLPDLSWDICARSPTIKDGFGLEVKAHKVDNDLSEYDGVIVPGGPGTRVLIKDDNFLNWLKSAKNVKYKISDCTGSLVWGAAGLLRGKCATTNLRESDLLKNYCDNVLTNRIVDDKNVISAGAVSSSLDLGLYLCTKWASKGAAAEISDRMDYKVDLNKILKDAATL